MAKINRQYSDINMNFISHPVSKDIVKVYDEESVKQAIKNLVFIQFYEKPFHPEIGNPLRGLLFEPMSRFISDVIAESIRTVIEENEKRVYLQEVSVSPNSDKNTYDITIKFNILNIKLPVVLNIILERV